MARATEPVAEVRLNVPEPKQTAMEHLTTEHNDPNDYDLEYSRRAGDIEPGTAIHLKQTKQPLFNSRRLAEISGIHGNTDHSTAGDTPVNMDNDTPDLTAGTTDYRSYGTRDYPVATSDAAMSAEAAAKSVSAAVIVENNSSSAPNVVRTARTVRRGAAVTPVPRPKTAKLYVEDTHSPANRAGDAVEGRDNATTNPDDDRVECSYCGRRFTPDRLEKHELACSKQLKRSARTFSSTDQRWAELETLGKPLVQGAPAEVSPKLLRSRRSFGATPRGEARRNWGSGEKRVEAFGEAKTSFRPEFDDPIMPQPSKEAPTSPTKIIEGDGTTSIVIVSTASPVSTNTSGQAQLIMTSDKKATDGAETRPSRHKHRHRHTKHRSSGSEPAGGFALTSSMQTTMAQPVAPSAQQVPALFESRTLYNQYNEQQYGVNAPPPVYAQPPSLCIFCVYCGAPFHDGAGFCGNCGAKRLGYDSALPQRQQYSARPQAQFGAGQMNAGTYGGAPYGYMH